MADLKRAGPKAARKVESKESLRGRSRRALRTEYCLLASYGHTSVGTRTVRRRLTDAPRVYCDANLPAGLIRFMRERLGWDVLFVLEEPRLRRASDIEHFRLAAQLRRTLLTLDRDYLDDARFPPAEGCGVLVLSAPDEAAVRASAQTGRSCAVRAIVR